VTFLKKAQNAVTKTSYVAGIFSALLVFPMMVVITLEATMRYLFMIQLNIAFDVAWLLFGVMAFLGSGYTMSQEGHIKVDIIYNKLKRRGQIIANAFCYPMFFFIPMAALLYFSFNSFVHDWVFNTRGYWTPMDYPMWPKQLLVFIGVVILALQGLVRLTQFIWAPKEGDHL